MLGCRDDLEVKSVTAGKDGARRESLARSDLYADGAGWQSSSEPAEQRFDFRRLECE